MPKSMQLIGYSIPGGAKFSRSLPRIKVRQTLRKIWHDPSLYSSPTLELTRQLAALPSCIPGCRNTAPCTYETITSAGFWPALHAVQKRLAPFPRMAVALNPLEARSSQSSNTGLYPPAKTIDDVGCELLDDLFPRAGGIIWNAPVILRLKVSSHPTKVLTPRRIFSSLSIRISQCMACIIDLRCLRLF